MDTIQVPQKLFQSIINYLLKCPAEGVLDLLIEIKALKEKLDKLPEPDLVSEK